MEKNNRDIAIIGISTRFPGANSLNEFWQNLLDGKESITFPKENGNSKAPFPHACIDGIELFDADFFNFSSKEAIYTDPQFRLLLESAWQALEDSGYNPETFKEEIGVYAGSYYSSYLFNNVLKSKKNKEDFLDQFDEIHRCVNDFLASSIAYKLNLTGPSLTVQSWCVSALSSIHVAVQALRNNECSMALAGGVTLHVPQESYKYQTITGFISKDGHCRSFDKDGHGATVGNGLGMVVLKRLDEAIENRDNIYAIIKGTGLTNDGKPISKLSYTGVTMGGQLRAINKAIADAGVKPNSVSYIEANGNATEISDRLELRAFALAYAEKDTKGEDLLIGAVKPNIGHLNSVAGLPGFVKAVLSLKNKEIPPTINFNSFNKKSIRNKTFIKVNDKLTKLNGNINKHKFGVHSFGIGGSNIHMILEEAPEIVSNKETREHNIITLSAKTSTSLKNKLIQYESFISSSSVHISDIAYTNNIGRKEFEYRYAFSFKNKEALLSSIKNEIENDSVKLGSINTSKKLAFTFPGYGDGVLNSAKDLYENEPVFNKYFKECSELLLSKYHINIEDILIKDDVINKKTSNDYFITFLSIFIIEYSMGKTLIEWGLKPDVLLGYSCGEFAAACISGIISIEEALFIINEFNTKINSTDKGRMLAIWIPKRDLDGLIDNTISIAGINGSDTFVLSGPVNSIKQLENTLILKNIDFLDIESDYAFHSYMMKPHADRITEKIGNFEFRSPKIDCYSLSTRNKLTSESYNQYSYWNDLLCKPVDFENSIKPILNDPNYVIVEVGTSNTLTQLVKNHPEYNSEQLAISCAGEISFTENLAQKSLMNTICKIWEQGITIDWESFYSCEERSRVSIPTYCFERKRYWVDEDKIDNGNEKREEDDTQKLIQEKEVLENNDVEKVIRDTWCKLFGKNDISINDDFVKLGGHSLIATMFINKMQVIYPSIDISFKDFFNNPTINQLSEYVRDELRTGPKKDISDLKIVIEFKEASPNERLLLMTEYFLSIICRIKGIKRGEITNEIDIKEFNLEDISGQIYTIFKRELSLPLYQFELLNKTSAKELLEFLTKEYEIRLGLVEESNIEEVHINSTHNNYSDNLEQKNDSAIFLLCAPRSGSTILRLMLAGHSKLFCPPELWLLGSKSMKEWNNKVEDHVKNHGGVLRSIVELIQGDRVLASNYLNDLIKKGSSVQEVYKLIQENAGNRILVDKSPDNSSNIKNLERAEQMFDKPKYIHLVRHPYSVVESIVRIRAYKIFNGSDSNPYKLAENDWYNRNLNLNNFFKGVDRERYIVIRYEDLMKNLKNELFKLCEFLNISFEETLLKPYEGKRMIDGDGDPNIFNHDDIESNLGDVWRNIELPHRLSPQTIELATKFGYYLPNEKLNSLNSEHDDSEYILNKEIIVDEIDNLKNLSDKEIEVMLSNYQLLNHNDK